jgi:Subtilase family
MTRALAIRLLLAAALAAPAPFERAKAQSVGCGPQPPPTNTFSANSFSAPCPPGRHHDNTVWYAVGIVVAGVIAWIIGTNVSASAPATTSTSTSIGTGPANVPPPTQVSLPPPGQNIPPAGPAGPAGPGGGPAPLKAGCDLPARGVTQFRRDFVVAEFAPGLSEAALDALAAQHQMTRIESQTFRRFGRTLHVWHIDSGASVEDMIINFCNVDSRVRGMQALFAYQLTAQAPAPIQPAPTQNAEQYAPDKLKLAEAHRLATGDRIKVAVIDSGVDPSHPDLAGAIIGNFDAVTGDTAPHPHGTGMAGAIAARRTLMGTAPRVGLLTIRAFSRAGSSPEGTTFSILKGLDWAIDQGARVINMSFAGPPDPRLRDAIIKTSRLGIVLVAAAGNAGPRSPPVFPGADPGVIAVTATDIDDALFPGANRGTYISVAAPGVDVLVPGPEGTYQLTTGTSVAAAEVSGVVALMLERNPALTPADVRRILMRTAKSLGPKGREREFGSGLVDALAAVQAARPR